EPVSPGLRLFWNGLPDVVAGASRIVLAPGLCYADKGRPPRRPATRAGTGNLQPFGKEYHEQRTAPPHRRGPYPPHPPAGLSLTSPASRPSARNSTPRWNRRASGTTRRRPATPSSSSSPSTACSTPSRHSPPRSL